MKNGQSATYQGFDTYTKQDHHSFVKENFKRLSEMIQEKLDSNRLPKNSNLLDVGCATGALVSYLSTVFPSFRLKGVDVSSELVKIARGKVPQAQFDVNSALSLPVQDTHAFDVVLFFGVLGIFEEEQAREALYNLIKVARPGGYVYLCNQFNEFDLDVMIKHRRTDPSESSGGWESGWNIYSHRTLEKWLNKRVKRFRFVDFEMPFAIQPADNPVRTWTIELTNGRRRLTNGLKLLVDLQFLEIEV